MNLLVDREGRLPLSPAFLLGAALVLGFSAATSVARADESEAKVARSEMTATLSRMDVAARTVREMLRDARRRDARSEVGCLDDALRRVNSARRTATREVSSSLDAYAVGEVDAARASRLRLGEIEATQRLAVREGAACRPPVVTATIVRVVVSP